jgi:hypothetical protein
MAFRVGPMHGYIQAAKPLHGIVDEIVDVVLAADISTHEFRLGAESAQFSGALSRRCGVISAA